MSSSFQVIQGDSAAVLRTLPAESIHCVVTSPPYWGLRSYSTGRWEGGSAECDHKQHHGSQGNSGQRADRAHTGEVPFKDTCGKCGALRIDLQLGLEKLHDCAGWVTGVKCGECFICHMVAVFAEVRRVLRPDGTCWANMGDCYATGAGAVGDHPGGGKQGAKWKGSVSPRGPRGQHLPHQAQVDRFTGHDGKSITKLQGERASGFRGDHPHDPKRNPASIAVGPQTQPNRMPIPGLKPKDLCMMPARFALALQADGWYLRSDIIWHKPNPMPESVSDRPTKSHEYIFLLTKSARYFYDIDAIKEPSSGNAHDRARKERSTEGQKTIPTSERNGMRPGVNPKAEKWPNAWSAEEGRHDGVSDGRHRPKQNASFSAAVVRTVQERNKRTVWTMPTQPTPESHFATFPLSLAETCILAGTSERGCCPKCAAPWERQTETSYENPGNRTTNGPRSTKRKHEEFGTAGFAVRLEKRTSTTGWRPTCHCIAEYAKASGLCSDQLSKEQWLALADTVGEYFLPVPCTVLDPFAGLCTTGLAALKNGRRFVGAELSPEYIAMAYERANRIYPLLVQGEVAVTAR